MCVLGLQLYLQQVEQNRHKTGLRKHVLKKERRDN